MELNYQTRSMLPNHHAIGSKVYGSLTLIGFAWGLASFTIIAANPKHFGISHGTYAYGQFLTGGIIATLVALILLPGYLVVRGEARRVERCREAISNCDYLVRWRYSSEDWKAFRLARAGSERNFWYGIMITLGVVFAGFFAGGVAMACSKTLANDPGGHRKMAVAGFFFVLAAVIGTIAAIYAMTNRRRRERLATPQESFISTLGAYVNGKWILWGTAARTLSRVQVKTPEDGGPTMLEFSVCNGDNTAVERVLVPADQEQLARRVAQRLMASPEQASGGQMGSVMLIARIAYCVLRLFA